MEKKPGMFKGLLGYILIVGIELLCWAGGIATIALIFKTLAR